MHFSEIIKPLFEKELHTWLRILKHFTHTVHEVSMKNALLPPIFFYDFNNSIIINRGKNTFELVRTVLKVALTQRKEEREPKFGSPYTFLMEIKT